MSPFENKGLILGIMAGTAGLSLVLVWYRKIRKHGAPARIHAFQDIGNKISSVGLQNEAPNEQGAVMVLHGRQLQILEKLNGLLLSVDELKREVEFLKEAIPKLEELVRNELQGKGDVQRVSPSHRAARRRKAETASGAKETTSSEEAESEGGYLTAHTDSEGDSEEEKKSPDVTVKSEEHEDLFNFLQQVDNLHKGSEDDKKEGFRLLLEKDDKYENCVDFLWRLARAYGDLFEMTTDAEEKRKYVTDADWKLADIVLIFKEGKKEYPGNYRSVSLTSMFGKVMEKIVLGGVEKHLKNSMVIGHSQHAFMRGKSCLSILISFYDKVAYLVDQGKPAVVIFSDTSKTLHTSRILLNKMSSTQLDKHAMGWFAIMCGYMSQFESVQNKIRNGYLFKEHLDKAIELKPQDPLLYYLNGRWCYSVAQLSWIEKKVATALFGTPPTSTVEEALQNFLKAEEMHPGYSKCNYVYLAKCYKDLGQKNNALKYCDSALSILSVTNEVGIESDNLFPCDCTLVFGIHYCTAGNNIMLRFFL
ncbi:regulator of microtubule dynamics 2 [Turdus rufiventris]|nr:regulator of microtubule dynamics 2 [Turdus rufiventris]